MHGQVLIKLFLSLVFILTACQNGGGGKNNKNISINNYEPALSEGAVIKFDTTTFNFGKVYEGEKLLAYFKFKNTGNKNLVLISATSDCGCTIPSFNNEPVIPGNEGEIKIVFDTESRTGHQYKSVSVETNGQPGEIELNITAEVIKK